MDRFLLEGFHYLTARILRYLAFQQPDFPSSALYSITEWFPRVNREVGDRLLHPTIMRIVSA